MPKFNLNSIFSTIDKMVQTMKSPNSTTNVSVPKSSFNSSVQNFRVAWLDANIDIDNNEDCQNTITQLKQVTNTIDMFTRTDQFIEFLSEIENEKIFVIVSGSLGETVVRVINEMSQIDSIFVFCRDQAKHQQWARSWSKVKDVFTDILPICELLKCATRQFDQEAVSISFVPYNERLPSPNLDQIDQSFMYTQILKEILLTIDFDQQSRTDFFTFCREQFVENQIELNNIEKLEREYHQHKPIWWYTYHCFLYSMLNHGLRMIEVDTIIKMGFFLRDLHEHIKQLHVEQYQNRRNSNVFTVFRGQSMSKSEFQLLLQSQGGLLSFNNFLSTSKKNDVSLKFARRSLSNPDNVGVLFVMTINPSSSSTPFASIKNISFYQAEREILFSMHSVFRVGSMRQIEEENDRLWQVDLTLTDDNDPQRRALTERMREETQGLTGWHRLGRLLIILGQYSKAEDLYKVLLSQSNDEQEKADYSHHLGAVKDQQGDYSAAIFHYEQSLEINRKFLSPDHPNLASSYTGIGLVYSKIFDYSKALTAHHQALEIFEKIFSPNNHRLAICHGNIGRVYDQMKDFDKALACHEKALEIFLNVLPHNDPHIATCYSDIGKVYDQMDDSTRAFSSYEKALDIRKSVLHPNHHLLAASYHDLGQILVKLGRHFQAVPLIDRAIDIARRSLPSDHSDLEQYERDLQSVSNILHSTIFQTTAL